MPESTPSFIPDINVWIALTYDGHAHHETAGSWWGQVGSVRIFFCRFTQLGFLRLLTNRHVMGKHVRNQVQAWRVFDRWMEDDRVSFLHEPPELDVIFRSLTQSAQPASDAWPDAYLAAVATAAGFTLVTMDRGLSSVPGMSALVLR